MAKATGRKLKVFQAQFGFHDSVVAAPSRAAALRAWSVRQDLFAEGRAIQTEDPEAAAAARAHPGVPLRRPLGSQGAFELAPSGLPALPAAPKPPKARRTSIRPAAPVKPPPDRGVLDAAEAALRAVDDKRRREEARLRAEQDELDRKIAERQAAYVEARAAASGAVVAARKAYRAAGGRD